MIHSTPSGGRTGRRSFIDVYNDSYRSLVAVARLTTGSNAPAEDLVQDAFADLYRRFEAVRSPDAYVRRAVMSRCTSWVRRRVTERRHLERQPPEEPALWTDPDTIVTMAAIGRLPIRQRAAIVLRYFSDMPEAEIAAALDCRPGTVKSLLARARTQLAKELNDDH
ncbi:MAG: RNA polymerase sigma factor [Ilumatobacteraceae bacterium]